MPIIKELKEFLGRQNIKYVTISHSLAYTAQETAELAHVSGTEIAKTMIVKIDGALAMAVLPGVPPRCFSLPSVTFQNVMMCALQPESLVLRSTPAHTNRGTE